jgi:ankyrin repeat protein
LRLIAAMSGLALVSKNSAYEPDKDIIKQLLDHGANPNLADKAGTTSLELAQTYQRPDLFILLKRAGGRKQPCTDPGRQ